jgi:hypothetical protein
MLDPAREMTPLLLALSFYDAFQARCLLHTVTDVWDPHVMTFFNL